MSDAGKVIPFLGAAPKSPPSNQAAEQSLLGAILAGGKAFSRVEDFLQARHFADPLHQQIFAAAAKRIQSGQIADPVTMRGEVSDPAYLAQLVAGSVGAYVAREYGLAIRDAWVRRQLIEMATSVVQRAYAEGVDVEMLLDTFAVEMDGIRDSSGEPQRGHTANEIMDEALAQADRAFAGGTSGISTGMSSVDRAIGGLEPSTLTVLAGRPGSGKAQPVDAKILMADGSWSLMGDLRRGDRIASIDGDQSRVVAVYERGQREVFRVTLSDGRSTECCAEHLWRVKYRDWPAWRVIDTARLQLMLSRKRYGRRLFVDVVSGEFGNQALHLPVDPYVLGVLLGDGCLRNKTASFTSFDPEMVAEVSYRLGLHCKVSRVGSKQAFSIASGGRSTNALGQFKSAAWLPDVLSELGLKGLRSEEKFVPPQYFLADKARRLDLLRGLMDTDGTVGRLGAVSFSSSSRALAEGVQRLVRSLGGLCSISEKHPFYTRRGERRDGLRSFQCNIRHPRGETFFLLPRKASRAIRGRNATVSLTIKSIEPSRVTGTRCISVSHPSRLYVTDDFTVTHNSSLGQQWAVAAARSGVPVVEFSLEMSGAALGRRILSAASGVPIWKMKRGQHAEHAERLLETRRELADLPITVHDGGRMSAAEIATKCRAAKRKTGLGLIVVDHLHLVRPEEATARHGPTAQVTEAVDAMLGIAKQFACPVLLLAQLNRGTEGRDDHRPTVADLRQSGAIEQNADTIAFVYREEQYIARDPPPKGQNQSPEAYANACTRHHEQRAAAVGKADLLCEKVRDGEPQTVRLRFDGPTASFSELSP